MDLKDNFRNLPIFITKVVNYSTIFKYVFKNGEFPEELQGMIDKKTPGYSRVLDILRAKKISQQYGCTNEKELMEAGEREWKGKYRKV